MPKVLIIEDSDDVREILKATLALRDFTVLEADHGQTGLEQAESGRPDVIILDLMLPDMDGIQVCERLKQNPRTEGIPVLMLTARTAVFDKVKGLEAGAEDYLIKPFDSLELIARVKVLLRRSGEDPSENRDPLKIGSLSIDPTNYTLAIDRKPVESLTPKEFDILYVLAKNSPKPVSREDIYQAIWGKSEKGFSRVIDIHIANLRKKIGAQRIKTIPSKGYFFAQI